MAIVRGLPSSYRGRKRHRGGAGGPEGAHEDSDGDIARDERQYEHPERMLAQAISQHHGAHQQDSDSRTRTAHEVPDSSSSHDHEQELSHYLTPDPR